jgi:hypothetical protein
MLKRWMALWGMVFAVEAMACGGATAPSHGANEAPRGPEVAAKEEPPPTPQAAETPKANEAEASAPKEEPKPAPPAEVTLDPAAQEIADSPGAPELEPGAQAIKRGEWVKAQRALEAAVKEMGGKEPLDVQMAAYALIGRACVKLNNDPCAEREFASIQRLFDRDAPTGEGAEREKRARAVLAAGEAVFYFAERKRKDADKLTMPVYNGAASREGVLKHVQTTVSDWVKKKQNIVEAADQAYAMIPTLKPVSPRWAVAAASRQGMLWGRFQAELRAAPIPSAWKQDGPIPGGNGMTYKELRAYYYEQLDEVSKPQIERARSAFAHCSDLSQKLRYTDESARTCDTWLAKNKAP